MCRIGLTFFIIVLKHGNSTVPKTNSILKTVIKEHDGLHIGSTRIFYKSQDAIDGTFYLEEKNSGKKQKFVMGLIFRLSSRRANNFFL